ncbi:ribosome recycling factor [Candidatus Peregrinibacteria bacterium]|jgi:ribosome recycling factor|nr:ribosome recycling factor [Candidatus Peregrinibacteria bacterium]MBT4148517.1 ribosome recycling factor [Candidatus Peregrinibacteria bacterium]MBT4366702.1 ribosome recycling factor [Candidatus Peregrinibacteria bacterium]MBT4455529.1 ribosome recycling factor [Candidatus Peregrinibacteria bacterium]
MVDNTIQTAKSGFQAAVERMGEEFKKLQIGRASAALVEGVMVEVYGAQQPLKAVASISIPDPKTISIQPWDKGVLGSVEKAIVAANLGLNPMNNGNSVMITMPPLTEERRGEVAKRVRELSEDAKISIRNVRQDAINAMKKAKDDKQITEDDVFSGEKKLQEAVDESNKQIEETAKSKEQSIMTL